MVFPGNSVRCRSARCTRHGHRTTAIRAGKGTSGDGSGCWVGHACSRSGAHSCTQSGDRGSCFGAGAGWRNDDECINDVGCGVSFRSTGESYRSRNGYTCRLKHAAASGGNSSSRFHGSRQVTFTQVDVTFQVPSNVPPQAGGKLQAAAALLLLLSVPPHPRAIAPSRTH